MIRRTEIHLDAESPQAAVVERDVGERRLIEGRKVPEAREEQLEATIADQQAHIAILTERHTFLTEREAELRQFLASAHAQLLTRDTDGHRLLTLLERIVEEQARRIDLLTADNDLLTAANDTLTADNDLLAAANNTLAAGNDILTMSNDTLAAANDILTADNNTLAAQCGDVIAAKGSSVAETERYVAELERSWNEKNTHIAMLEAMGQPARRGFLGRVMRCARSIIARW